ncbi:MAG: hypothetical protein NTW96_25425 [Planctomycetia bacterium]|nr:hypothetical protein [Planctomycetia bacterium]
MAMRSKRSKPDWPPPWARLPDSLDAIEAGSLTPLNLFDKDLDHSRKSRLRRLFGLDPKPRDRKIGREGA